MSGNESTKANDRRENSGFTVNELSSSSINSTVVKEPNQEEIKKNSTFPQLMETFFPENSMKIKNISFTVNPTRLSQK